MEHVRNKQLLVLKHNYLFNVLDGGFFGFALGLASFSAVIPLFVSTFTSSALLIGLIPALHNIGWQLPQLLTARRVASLLRLKPTVLALTIQERLPFVGLAVVAYLAPTLGPKICLIATFLLLTWQGLGGGVTANAWQNLIARVIPGEYRATFYGFQSAAANLLASVGAVLSGLVLEKVPSPWDFTICFGSAVLLMIISYIMISQNIEYPIPKPDIAGTSRDFWLEVLFILRSDRNFDWFLLARSLMQFAMMAAAFYTVYAVNTLGMSRSGAGLMASLLMATQVIANPLLGWLSDRYGRRHVLILGAMSAAASAFMAYFAPSIGWFFPVSALAGLAFTSNWTIGLAISSEFGNDTSRPAYVGLANTLVAPSALFSLLAGGWLADLVGYPYAFLAAGMSGILAAGVYFIFMRDPS
jgi:MFS family permease